MCIRDRTDPEQAPTKAKSMIKIGNKTPILSRSVIVNPVVVIIDIVWNIPYLNDSLKPTFSLNSKTKTENVVTARISNKKNLNSSLFT